VVPACSRPIRFCGVRGLAKSARVHRRRSGTSCSGWVLICLAWPTRSHKAETTTTGPSAQRDQREEQHINSVRGPGPASRYPRRQVSLPDTNLPTVLYWYAVKMWILVRANVISQSSLCRFAKFRTSKQASKPLFSLIGPLRWAYDFAGGSKPAYPPGPLRSFEERGRSRAIPLLRVGVVRAAARRSVHRVDDCYGWPIKISGGIPRTLGSARSACPGEH
jgi:hypothetical protein